MRIKGKLGNWSLYAIWEKDRDFGTSKGWKVLNTERENKCFVDKHLLGHAETIGRRVDIGLQALLSKFRLPHLAHIFFIDISGDSALPGSGSLSKLF